MISRRFSIGQKVAAIAPMLLLLVYLPGQMMLRCRIDGGLRAACCCPHANEGQGSKPVFKARDCCDQEMTSGERPVVEAARRTAADVPLTVAVALTVSTLSLEPVAPDRAARAWQAQGPPGDRPPLVLLKHAFLI